MDYYAYFWGVIKYLLPAMIFVIAVWIAPNALLLMIAVIWISSSIIVSALSMGSEESEQGRHYNF